MPQVEKVGFTPGPWSEKSSEPWRVERDGSSADVGIGPKGRAVVAIAVTTRHYTDEEFSANARLIAAAPTMAEYIARKAADGDDEAATIMEAIDGRR